LVAGFLPDDPGGGRPRSVCLRAVADAVFYVLKTGCPWRFLPVDFPPWTTVYRYFRRWEVDGVVERMHDVLRSIVRVRESKNPEPTAGIIDSQTVKSAPQAVDGVGYDGGKKVKGRKRHIVVDTLGLLLGLRVHAADVQDRDGAAMVFEAMEGRHQLLDVVFADGGYQGPRAAAGCPVDLVVVKRTEPGFAVLPKRWIVERTFAWLTQNRRLVKDYEGLASVSEAFVRLAMIRLMLRRIFG
jgi:putative transposase